MAQRVSEPAANAKNAARVSRYALTAHWIPVLLSDSSRWMSGTAIDTMVWSMNIIATAKIIAVRIKAFERPGLPDTIGSHARGLAAVGAVLVGTVNRL